MCHGLAPESLSELVLPSTVTYATRSSFDTSLLHIPKIKTVAGDNASMMLRRDSGGTATFLKHQGSTNYSCF